jgi:hypothetical protein
MGHGNKRRARGEGCFLESPNGKVAYRKSVGYKADGKRKILTVTAVSRAAAVREMKKKRGCLAENAARHAF